MKPLEHRSQDERRSLGEALMEAFGDDAQVSALLGTKPDRQPRAETARSSSGG
jgi:hypothetical protein